MNPDSSVGVSEKLNLPRVSAKPLGKTNMPVHLLLSLKSFSFHTVLCSYGSISSTFGLRRLF